MENKKKEPWRILVGGISIAYILFMWVKKDVLSIYTTMQPEEALPLIVTTVAVTLLKVALLAGAILLGKWVVRKIGNKRKDT